ncbi:hypothetical protein ACROYT_G014041 [Oculina patagonica]
MHVKGVAFFFSAVVVLERRGKNKSKKENNEDEEDGENEISEKTYWPAINYWIAVQSPNGMRVSTVPVHSALLHTGMEVTANTLPECKRGNEEKSAAPLCNTLKDHNNKFLQNKVDISFSNGMEILQDQLLDEPMSSLHRSERVVRMQAVSSLFEPVSHTVEIKGDKLTCSACPRFKDRGICAYTLAAAHQLGKFQQYTQAYQVPLSGLVGSNIPSGAVKKENEKKNRKRKPSTPRDLQTYGDIVETEELEVELSPYEVVLIKYTKATTCYGCKGCVRKTASDPPPPAPNNVFFRHMEHRGFNRQGETNIRIFATPEAVYYHPLRLCAPSATSTNI